MKRDAVLGALFGLTFGYVGLAAVAVIFRLRKGRWPAECPHCGAWT